MVVPPTPPAPTTEFLTLGFTPLFQFIARYNFYSLMTKKISNQSITPFKEVLKKD